MLGGLKGGNAKASKRRNEYTDTFKRTQITRYPARPGPWLTPEGSGRLVRAREERVRVSLCPPERAAAASVTGTRLHARVPGMAGGRSCPPHARSRAKGAPVMSGGGGSVAAPSLSARQSYQRPEWAVLLILCARVTRAHPGGQLWRAAESGLARRRLGGWPAWASDLITRAASRAMRCCPRARNLAFRAVAVCVATVDAETRADVVRLHWLTRLPTTLSSVIRFMGGHCFIVDERIIQLID
jgi:hypothetical protein